MPEPALTDWITSIGTLLAVGVAGYASWQSKRAADQAANAAQIAGAQVELQRPRPIVIVEFANRFSENARPGDEADKDFKLTNIGDSPAFDVEVSSLIVGEHQLKTETVPYLLQSQPAQCIHRLEPFEGGMSRLLGKADSFVRSAAKHFLQSGPLDPTVHSIPFMVSYRALDKRRRIQSYELLTNVLISRSWTKPVGSLVLQPEGLDEL